MARIRTLRRFDYLPDFVCQGACRTLHTASLAGRRWILVAMPGVSPDSQLLPESARARATEHVIRVVYTMVGPESAASNSAGRDDVHAVGDERVARLLFGDHDARGSACCLLIDRDQKILHRVDCAAADLPGVLDGVMDLSLRAPDRAETEMIPVLHVPHALDDDVCDRLVEHHRRSSHKVQGRVGLSASHLDLTLKRVVHVNVDPELGTAIDEHLIFSLLPAIERIFDYRVTHRVAYKISFYAAADSGFFTTHRDNSDPGTLFRRFALSLALNDEWSGGGICFPEYSSRPFQLPKGDAVVFPASLLHRVEPILEGERFVLLSFFYDSDGALARRAAMSNPEVLEGRYKDSISADLISAYDEYAPLSRFSPQYALTGEP